MSFFEKFHRLDDALAMEFVEKFETNSINLKGYIILFTEEIINMVSGLPMEENSLIEKYHYDALLQKFHGPREPHTKLYINGAHT